VDVRRFVTGDGRTVRASAEIATNSLFYLADRGIAMQTADGIGRMRIFVTLRRKPDRMKGGPVSDPRGSKAYKQTSAAGGHSIPLPSDASNRTANAGRLSLRGARSSNGVGVQSSIEIMRNPCLLAYAPTLRPEGEEDRGR
jgi:hypothetical protein